MNKFLEKSGKLVDGWYVTLLQKELKKGNALRCIIFEVPLVIWKAKNGTVSALLDRCAHRHAPLSAGTVENNCIRCPYHAWTYDTKGNCSDIPYESIDENTSSIKVKSFPVKVQDGLIWVWMGESEPNKSPFDMPNRKKKGWGSYYMKTEFDNDVTNLVENFMDVPHTIEVHKGWFRSQKKLEVNTSVELCDDAVKVTYLQQQDSIGFFGRLINPKKLPMHHTDKFYMPNNTRVDYMFGTERGFIITSTITPISEKKSMVYTLISYKMGWLQGFMALFLPFYTKTVINQDVWIMKEHSKNLNKFSGIEYRSVGIDIMHVYIKALRDFAKSNGKIAKPKPTTKKVSFKI